MQGHAGARPSYLKASKAVVAFMKEAMRTPVIVAVKIPPAWVETEQDTQYPKQEQNSTTGHTHLL